MTTNAPAGWYADPSNSAQLRYWDGAQWTEQITPSAPIPSSSTAAPPVAVTPPSKVAVPNPPAREKGGLFGSKKSLEAERDELRQLVDSFGYAEREALRVQLAQLAREAEGVRAELDTKRKELREAESRIVKAREEEILQEVGLYDYRHRLEDSTSYKSRIDSLRARIKEMCKADGGAVVGATAWQVNGSAAQGRKMVKDLSKLLLRAYNGEADELVSRMKPYKLESAVDQLGKARDAISKLGSMMQINVTDVYHRLRIEELSLTADYLAKKEEERELERAEKERLREEEKARREIEAEKARLAKERVHYATALEKIRATGTPEEIAAAEVKLAEVEGALEGVEKREANVRAGYVYVISNVGALGLGVVKVGMTRRLDPMDRVRELGDASVPFQFDVHALVFADDAVSLENRLHQALAAKRVNLVNQRREFFYATPNEVKDLIGKLGGSVLEFVSEPEASEWHQSENARKRNNG